MKPYIFLCCCLLLVKQAVCQSLTKQDYTRAVSFLGSNLFNKKVFNINPQFSWFADSSGVAFALFKKDEKVFYKIDWKTKQMQRLFDHERLAVILTDSLKTTIKASALPFSSVKCINKNLVEFTAAEKEWRLNLATYLLTEIKKEPHNEMETASPDGKWIAFSKDFNLFIKSVANGQVKQLSSSGIKNNEYATDYGWGEIITGENGERPPHFFVTWSPDSKWIGTYVTDFRNGQKMYLLDWSIDTLYKPKLLSYYRGSPGDTDMVYLTPVFFNIESGEEFKKEEFRNVNAAGFEWAKEPGVVYIENRVRGYQQVDLYRYNLANASTEKLYTEKSSTNIDNYNSQVVGDSSQILINSEKSGWKQLYLLNVQTKSVTPVTNGAFYVNDILYTDKKKSVIIFTASGRERDRNPYYLHLYKINMDGSGLTLLTPENANHDVTISPDGKYFTDNISTMNTVPHAVLRETASGKTVAQLTTANIDALTQMHVRFPEPFSCTARDGVTIIYGAIWKPTNFDSTKKYPVIDQSYTGPHTFMFPRNFVSAMARSNQALAELGFIVIAVDGMGTANRSKAFHNVSYKNMGKNLTDHVLAIRELAKRYSWADSNRVGIFGHSAGGYDAGHAVLEFPDFYKVAVASSGDHDFRMEKDWWPEMYMGWPVDSTYEQASNITMAKNLKGKLLLVHGGIDENVNPSATFKLAEALVKADKEFDMLILPSQHHGYAGKYNEYFTKKKWNYFVEHLLGVKPIWDFELK